MKRITMSKKTKEDMLQNMGISFGMHQDNSLEDILTSMDEYAKQEAKGFFIWYGTKITALIEYIQDIRPRVISEEIEEKIVEFEGQPIEKLYELYQKSKQQ